TAAPELLAAVESARIHRHTVVVNLPITVLTAPDPGVAVTRAGRPPPVVEPSGEALQEFAGMLARSRRPVFIAGRGAQDAREELRALGERVGALLATSAVSAGLFAGDEWSLGVSGGFSSPRAAELIADADLVVGWGASLHMWTTRHGGLMSPQAQVVQVDDTPSALGRHLPVHLAVHGSVRSTAEALSHYLPERLGLGYRAVGKDALAQVNWRDVPYEDASDG